MSGLVLGLGLEKLVLADLWNNCPKVFIEFIVSQNKRTLFITDTGTVMTHGYNSAHTSAGGQELALQHTTMCIRQNKGYCSGKFTAFFLQQAKLIFNSLYLLVQQCIVHKQKNI